MNRFATITRRVLPVASLSALAGAAHAEVPAAVTTAVEGIKTDGMAVATAVLLAVVAIYAIKFIRKGL